MNRNWTGKLQVTILFAYIFWKKLCLCTFKASSEEVIVWENEDKIYEGGYVKEFFS